MDGKKIVGVVLVLIGIGLVFFGVNRLNSFTSQVVSALGATDTTAYGQIIVGAIVGIIGIALLVSKSRQS